VVMVVVVVLWTGKCVKKNGAEDGGVPRLESE